MRKLLPHLFDPVFLVYDYRVHVSVVKERIEAVGAKGGTFFSEPDIRGRFVSSSVFVVYVSSGAYTEAVRFGSVLQGRLIEADTLSTRVEVKIACSGYYRVGSVFFLIVGGAFLLTAINTLSLSFLAWALVLLALGPAFCNWLAGIANETVLDRYRRYIDKELRKATAPQTR